MGGRAAGSIPDKIMGFLYKETQKNVKVPLSGKKKGTKFLSESLVCPYYVSEFWKDEVAFILSTQFWYKASVSWASS